MSRLDKYTCVDCLTSLWALSNPLTCNRCGSMVHLTQQGVTDIPSALYFEQNEKAVVFDWDEFNQWWDTQNA